MTDSTAGTPGSGTRCAHAVVLYAEISQEPFLIRTCSAGLGCRDVLVERTGLRVLVSRFRTDQTRPGFMHGCHRPRAFGERLPERAAREPFAWSC